MLNPIATNKNCTYYLNLEKFVEFELNIINFNIIY